MWLLVTIDGTTFAAKLVTAGFPLEKPTKELERDPRSVNNAWFHPFLLADVGILRLFCFLSYLTYKDNPSKAELANEFIAKLFTAEKNDAVLQADLRSLIHAYSW